MITINNYFEKTEGITWSKLPEALSKGNSFVKTASDNNWKAYKESDTIKRVVEAYFRKLEAYIKTIPQSKTTTPKTEIRKKVVPKETPKTRKASSPKKEIQRVSYWNIEVEIRKVSEHSTKFIIWDIAKKRPFSDDRYDSFEDAKSHALENRMVVLSPLTPSKTKTQTQVVRKHNYEGEKVEIRKASPRSTKLIVWVVDKNMKFANERFDTRAEAVAFVKENKMELVSSKVTSRKAKMVEKITSDIQFIRRYVAMNGKVKTQAQILGLLSSLQRAILEKRINKHSPYANEIKVMQEQLIYLYEKMGDSCEVKIDAKNLEKYQSIAGSQKGLYSIQLLKAYVGLTGKTGILDKAKKLAQRMNDAIRTDRVTCSDPYKKQLNSAYTRLTAYISKKTKTIEISKSELNGLGCLKESIGEYAPSSRQSNVISSGDLLKMQFETIGLQGKYRTLIGDPSVGFLAMVYGLPKSGKSTFCIQFAHYLAVNHGKVLYCAVEEGFGYTFKEKIQRFNAIHPLLFITDKLPTNLDNYDFVFIDSVSRAGIELEDIQRLHKRHPRTAFVFIYHATKEGKFRGGNDHAHEVDTIIQIEKGKVTNSGRFNQGGEMRV